MTQTPGRPAKKMFPMININFDFYVGLSSSSETGSWDVHTVQNDVPGSTLEDVDSTDVQDAEEILRGDLKGAGTEFLFVTSAGYNLAEPELAELETRGTQIYLNVKIQADNKKALLSALEYLSSEIQKSETGEIDLDSDDHESAITASSEIREDEDEN